MKRIKVSLSSEELDIIMSSIEFGSMHLRNDVSRYRALATKQSIRARINKRTNIIRKLRIAKLKLQEEV